MHVAAEARRQAVRDDLDHAAEGVAVLVRGVDLGLHRGARGGVQAAHRVGVDAVAVVRFGHVVVRRADGAEAHHMTDDLRAEHLAQQPAGYLAERDPAAVSLALARSRTALASS